MNSEHNHEPQQQKSPKEKSFWFSFRGCIALIIIAIMVYYLITEHSAHIAGFFAGFPWLPLVLLCPLMHLMHGGHGGHGGQHHKTKKDDEISPDKKD
jgi:L-asparagine transporter-like permease